MNTVDIIILLALVPFLVQGVRKGFISQLSAFVSVLLGLWLAFRLSVPASEYLRPYIQVSDAVLHVVAFVLILILVVFLLNLLGGALQKLVKLVMLGWLDKLLGIVFALLKGLIVVGVLVLLFESLNANFSLVPQETLDGSVLYGPVKEAVDQFFPYFKELIAKQ